MVQSSFRFDRERACQVYLPLHQAYKNSTHAYSVLNAENSAPQNVFIPEGMVRGSTEHVRYLFLAMLVTLRSKSSIGFEKMLVLYKQNPELFTSAARGATPEDIVAAFRSASVPHQHSWARYWIDCARALFDSYHGDPLFLISEAQREGGSGDVVKGFLRIKKRLKKQKESHFNGLGEKLFSLYCIFCEDLGLVRGVTDTMPVDVWLQNIALATGVVTPKNKAVRLDSTELARFLRKQLTRFALEEGISLTDISHVLWLHGSVVCDQCHRFRNLEGVCPINELCGGSLYADPYWKKGKWRLDIPREQKGNSTFLPPENVDFLPENTLRARKLDQKDKAEVLNTSEDMGIQLSLFEKDED